MICEEYLRLGTKLRGESLKLKKDERRIAIRNAIEANPFITDNELCEKFDVSIQTIRLDRTHLNIPELRKRIKLVAEQNYGQIKSIEANEIIGDLIQVEPDVKAQSLIEITEDYVLQNTNRKGTYSLCSVKLSMRSTYT